MREEIEATILTEDGVRVSVSEWDDGGAWLHLTMRGSTAHAALTRAEAQQLLEGLQAVLNAEAV